MSLSLLFILVEYPLCVIVIDLLQHLVRQVESAQRPVVSELGDIEVLVVRLQYTEDIAVHLQLITVVRAEQYAILVLD